MPSSFRLFLAFVCGYLAIIAGGASSARAQSFAYVDNQNSNNVSVISTASNTVVATVAVGNNPRGLAATPDGSLVYVTNANDKHRLGDQYRQQCSCRDGPGRDVPSWCRDYA
jgi:YVTN family beta-propeller protein